MNKMVIKFIRLFFGYKRKPKKGRHAKFCGFQLEHQQKFCRPFLSEINQNSGMEINFKILILEEPFTHQCPPPFTFTWLNKGTGKCN